MPRKPDNRKPGRVQAGVYVALAAALMLAGCAAFVCGGPRQPSEVVPLPDSGIITPPRHDQAALRVQ